MPRVQQVEAAAGGDDRAAARAHPRATHALRPVDAGRGRVGLGGSRGRADAARGHELRGGAATAATTASPGSAPSASASAAAAAKRVAGAARSATGDAARRARRPARPCP